MKTAIILYELNQLASLDVLFARGSENGKTPLIVSLDAEIDFALEKRGIPFVSGKTLQNRTAPSAYIRAEEMVRAVYDHNELSFLSYRNISCTRSLRFSAHIYLGMLLYHIDVLERFMEGAPKIEHVVVPIPIASTSKTSDVLAIEESRIVYEAARLVTERRGVRCEPYDTHSVTSRLKTHWQGWVFTAKRTLFGIALTILNTVIALRPRRPIRIVASDYWRNISPTMRQLPEAELILIDRKEAFSAGLKNIWRHNIRFLHINHFLSLLGRQRARIHTNACIKEWMNVRKSVFASLNFTFCGADLNQTMERVMTRLIETALPDIVADIEAAYALYERLSPDAVLLRASVSRQRHFPILALVAREVSIPALEVQHGGEYLGPGSGNHNHAAHFLATYGPLVCNEFRTLGYEQKRLLPIGSPRFDAYIADAQKKAARQKESSTLTILSNTPTMDINERYGTYSIEEYFKTLGGAVRKISNARLLVASRSNILSEFNKEARARGFVGVNYESVGTTPLTELFRRADIFVCSYSTVVYEALIYRLPVILTAFAPVEKMMANFHFSHFEKAGALAIAHTPEELREIVGKLAANPEARARMSSAAEAFMKEQFSFDGHASERIAALIRNWKKGGDSRA